MAQTRLECVDRGQSNDRYRNSEVTVPAHTQSVTQVIDVRLCQRRATAPLDTKSPR